MISSFLRLAGALGLLASSTELPPVRAADPVGVAAVSDANQLMKLANQHFLHGRFDEERSVRLRLVHLLEGYPGRSDQERRKQLGHLSSVERLLALPTGERESVRAARNAFVAAVRAAPADRRREAHADAIRNVIASQEQTLGPDDGALSELEFMLGVVLQDLGRFDEAERHLLRAAELRTAQRGEASAGPVITQLCLLRVRQGRSAEAIHHGEMAVRLVAAGWGQGSDEVVATEFNLAVAYNNAGRQSEAEPLFAAAERYWLQTVGPEDQLTLLCRYERARSLAVLRPAESIRLFEETIAAVERPGRGADLLAEAKPSLYREYADVLRAAGRTGEADVAAKKAADMKAADGINPSDPLPNESR